MEVTKYEIDMLSVGAADAFLIRFFDEKEEQHVILVEKDRRIRKEEIQYIYYRLSNMYSL